MSQQRSNIRISGSGKVSGGLYDDIHISGSGYVEGACDAIGIRVSGSAHFNGAVTVEQKLHCSGACHVEGDLRAQEIHTSGSLLCDAAQGGSLGVSGSANASSFDFDDMRISGSVTSSGSIHAKKLQCSGKLKAEDGIESEEAYVSGRLDVHGLINANQLEIKLDSRGTSTVEDIGGDSIVIRPGETHWITGLFGLGKHALIAKTIEGSNVDLYFTQADVVRGADVRINEGCHIKRVEYTHSLHVDPAARVDEVGGEG